TAVVPVKGSSAAASSAMATTHSPGSPDVVWGWALAGPVPDAAGGAGGWEGAQAATSARPVAPTPCTNWRRLKVRLWRSIDCPSPALIIALRVAAVKLIVVEPGPPRR